MLTESGVLASGSRRGVLQGTYFNRCKRMHPLLALCLEILYFRAFFDLYANKEDAEIELFSVLSSRTDTVWENVEDSTIIKNIIIAYEDFCNATRSGPHGATAQFWMLYIELIHTFNEFERAVRTNDIQLFIQSLTPMIHLFFATNHINYSRWISKYQLDLLNMYKTHPGLRDILEEGVFTIRRTSHSFSRCPVDLTLEQTVNADAASRLTGIGSFTTNHNARLRWMITKTSRAAFVSSLFEMAGVIPKEDTTAELQIARIKRDRSDCQKITQQILSSFNPFDNLIIQSPSSTLFNIHNGKSAPEEVKSYLLNIKRIGEELHVNFVREYQSNQSRFEEPIRKVNIHTFQETGATNRRTTDLKIAELKCSRDLMGRLLVLATKKNLDLHHVFSFPLTPVPLSLSTEQLPKHKRALYSTTWKIKLSQHRHPCQQLLAL